MQKILGLLSKFFTLSWYGAVAVTGACLFGLLAITLTTVAALLAFVMSIVLLPLTVLHFANDNRQLKPYLLKIIEAIPLAIIILIGTPSISFFIIVLATIFSAIYGFNTGWNDGLTGLIHAPAKVVTFLFQLLREIRGEEHGAYSIHRNRHAQQRRDIEGVDENVTSVNDAFNQFFAQQRFDAGDEDLFNQIFLENLAARNNQSLGMSAEQWQQLALTQDELHSLKTEYKVFDQTQEAFLKTKCPNPMIDSYFALKERLNERMCAIVLDKPETIEDTIVLFKQYHDGFNWLPVPNSTRIFDANSLKEWVVGRNSTHPLTREDLNNPDSYNSNTTRYRYHPYALAINGEEVLGVSQELNQIIQTLHQNFPELNKTDEVSQDDDFDGDMLRSCYTP